MSIAIMQPYFFPYIGYWQLIDAVDIFVIYDDVNYIKKGYINRNNIIVNGQKQYFTLEVIGASQNKLINEVRVGNNQFKLLKTVELAYKKAPFFKKTYPIIEEILSQNENNLARFLQYSLLLISEHIQINTNFIFSSDITKDNTLKAQDKVIDIIKRLKEDNYINAIGGNKLYDKNRFHHENISLYFIKTEYKEYKQFDNRFVPYLSIIDILMFNSPDKVNKMLGSYKLV